jgi:hypothetical protein
LFGGGLGIVPLDELALYSCWVRFGFGGGAGGGGGGGGGAGLPLLVVPGPLIAGPLKSLGVLTDGWL